MKSNLAILSSDQKSIDFIKKNKLNITLNLYANSSRNVDVAETFAETHKIKKYYGTYEDLLSDKGIDFVLNFLPSGIKFEYIYLCLKNNIKVITDYPIISNSNDLDHYNELINSRLINNLFLIDEINIKKLYQESIIKSNIHFSKNIFQHNETNNSLDKKDVLFELSPELFFLIYKYRNQKISIFKKELIFDNITNKLIYFKCDIEINKNLKINVNLNSNKLNKYLINDLEWSEFHLNNPIYNANDLNSFIIANNSFENLSIFSYYPYKLFQGVINE